MEARLEKRGEIIRLVQTLRGGDRPKNAHNEFHDVTVMPRSAWEPWGLFRKPCEGRVQDNLRKWKTGGLRRRSDDIPFTDVIQSAPTRREERAISASPLFKATSLHAANLSGRHSPLVQALFLIHSWGAVLRSRLRSQWGMKASVLKAITSFFDMAVNAIPALTALNGSGKSNSQAATSLPSTRAAENLQMLNES